jgi:NAD(P)-dependent dehydrogenase (short-subunit alcohol dehydrogenase family)
MMLDGRVVIVTGGGGGLGRAHCLELAAHGAAVVVNDLGTSLHGEGRAESPAELVATEIRAGGGTALVDDSSVADWVAMEKLVERTVQELGRLDAIVNNAGITRDRMLTSMSEEDVDLVLAVHVKGTIALSHHACSYWRAEGKAGRDSSGRIVNTTSGSGLFGNIGQANYGAAKSAIATVTVITAMEMARYGVTANAISPIAATRMTAGLPIGEIDAGNGTWHPRDPANASPVVAWLCSERSGWLSGAVLRIDGNRVQRVRGWEIDDDVAFTSASGERLDATELDAGLRAVWPSAVGQPG